MKRNGHLISAWFSDSVGATLIKSVCLVMPNKWAVGSLPHKAHQCSGVGNGDQSALNMDRLGQFFEKKIDKESPFHILLPRYFFA